MMLGPNAYLDGWWDGFAACAAWWVLLSGLAVLAFAACRFAREWRAGRRRYRLAREYAGRQADALRRFGTGGRRPPRPYEDPGEGVTP